MVTIYCTACGASDEIPKEMAREVYKQGVEVSGEDPPPPPICLCRECREAMGDSGKSYFLKNGKTLEFETVDGLLDFTRLWVGQGQRDNGDI